MLLTPRKLNEKNFYDQHWICSKPHSAPDDHHPDAVRVMLRSRSRSKSKWTLGRTRMVQSSTLRRPDRFEVRRQLVRARNRHSNNQAIVRRINSLLCRIYHLNAIDTKQVGEFGKPLYIKCGELNPKSRALTAMVPSHQIADRSEVLAWIRSRVVTPILVHRR